MNEAKHTCVRVHTQLEPGKRWLEKFRGQKPIFACVLGFTKTGLLPGISAAGSSPQDRQYTAIADAEFLYYGPQPQPNHPLPPLHAGASPVLISRAMVQALDMPVFIFNAGLPAPLTIPAIDLAGLPAACLSGGTALPIDTVTHLLQQGLHWGEKLALEATNSYVILGECVVGGTTTALAVLTGLGFDARGMVNSSHPTCNHSQKWALVKAGLEQARFYSQVHSLQPLEIVAAVGDPMQIVVAGMAIAASRSCGVLLAGGTQMLAVYALLRAIAQTQRLPWQPEHILVGTTRWVTDDPTGDTVGLARLVNDVPLLSTQLDFTKSRYRHFRAYEQGYVKEGVGAGGCAIAAYLYQNWGQGQLLDAIEQLAERYQQINQSMNPV